MEGVTGYLTKAELNAMFGAISDLSARSSVLLATWLGLESSGVLTMHRFLTNDPSGAVKPFGWTEMDLQTVHSAGAQLGRPEGSKHYFMSCHSYKENTG